MFGIDYKVQKKLILKRRVTSFSDVTSNKCQKQEIFCFNKREKLINWTEKVLKVICFWKYEANRKWWMVFRKSFQFFTSYADSASKNSKTNLTFCFLVRLHNMNICLHFNQREKLAANFFLHRWFDFFYSSLRYTAYLSEVLFFFCSVVYRSFRQFLTSSWHISLN